MSVDCLYIHVAYKTEDNVTYKYKAVYSEEENDYVDTWVKTDDKPEDDKYLRYELLNVEFTPFSQYKSASDERVLINTTTAGNGQIASSDDGSEPVFDDEYPYQQAVYNTVKGTTVKLTKKNKGFLSKLFGKK